MMILSFISVVTACSEQPSLDNWSKAMEIKIKSSVFRDGEFIPAKYTCDGDNISPPLEWKVSPEGTKTFALISDDPDAPMGTWVHWVIYNIPSDVRELAENIPSLPSLPGGAVQGVSDFGSTGYGGPCPPSGSHRYFFKLYALDTRLDLGSGATKKKLLEAMKGHILAEGQLMGRYKRQR
ncbi:YbhB/YbcL family Raf kinase inhibitor-like protein [Candidatus Latescibacterota bacterium]